MREIVHVEVFRHTRGRSVSTVRVDPPPTCSVAIVSTDSVEWDRSENRFDLFGIGRAVPDAQWADPCAALPTDAHWRRSDIEPTPGERRLVYLQQLVFPDSGWITFQPPLAAVN